MDANIIKGEGIGDQEVQGHRSIIPTYFLLICKG